MANTLKGETKLKHFKIEMYSPKEIKFYSIFPQHLLQTLNRKTKPFPKKCKSQCNNSDSGSFWTTKEHHVHLRSAYRSSKGGQAGRDEGSRAQVPVTPTLPKQTVAETAGCS